jgi:hypothetical protein
MLCSRYLQEIKKGEITVKQLAQEIEDGLGTEVFNKQVAELTKLQGSALLHESTKKRLSYLARIPFRAIVTTNYNNLLDGDQCTPDSQEAAAESAGGAATAISKGALNPQHNFEKILRPGPGASRFGCRNANRI